SSNRSASIRSLPPCDPKRSRLAPRDGVCGLPANSSPELSDNFICLQLVDCASSRVGKRGSCLARKPQWSGESIPHLAERDAHNVAVSLRETSSVRSPQFVRLDFDVKPKPCLAERGARRRQARDLFLKRDCDVLLLPV